MDRHNAHEFNHGNVSEPTLSADFKGPSLVFRRYDDKSYGLRRARRLKRPPQRHRPSRFLLINICKQKNEPPPDKKTMIRHFT